MTLTSTAIPAATAAVREQRRRRLRLPGRRRHSTSRSLLSIAVVLVLVYVVIGPLVLLVVSSLQDSGISLPMSAEAVWTPKNYVTVFGDAATYSTLLQTFIYGGGALVIALVLSLVFAFLVERTDLPWRNGLFVLLVAPSGMPFLIVAIAWSMLLNPTNGLLNTGVFNRLGFTIDAYSFPVMILVQGVGLVPLTFLLVTAAFRGINSSLEDAAMASGANRFTVMRRVTLPLLTPAILGAVVYMFVNVIETLDIPLVLGLPANKIVLSTHLFLTVKPPSGLADYGTSSTFGILMLLLALAPLLLYNRLVARRGQYATVTGKTFRAKQIRLGAWRWPALLGVLAYVFVTFFLPFLTLVWVSLQPFYSGISRAAFGRISFRGYHAIVESGTVTSALKNTLVLGVASAVAAMALALLVSWIIVRARTRLIWLLDLLAFMPHAMPGVVIGLSIGLIYLLLPLPVYGTIWIIVIAMSTQYISLGTRLTTSGMVQLQESLEDAGSVSGAGTFMIWRRILLPLLRPSIASGLLLVFLAACQNLTLPLMLESPSNVTLSTLLWGRWNTGDVNGAAVLCVVMTVVTVVAVTTVRLSTASRDREPAGAGRI